MPLNSASSKFIVNAAAPQPAADKAFEIATNQGSTFVTPESARLLITGFGLQVLKPIAFRAGQGLTTGVERDYVLPEEPDYAALNIQGAPGVGSGFKFALCAFARSERAEDLNNAVRLDAALISVSQTKNIVTTAVQGRPGTVKEFTSRGDYMINVRGIMIGNDAYTYPQDKVVALLDILKLGTNIYVASNYLIELFEITDVVVSNFRLQQQEGRQNSQLISIDLMSDEPVDLREEV